MSDKREYKVISSVSDRNGKHAYWARIGTAWSNKDNSVNVYMDVFPKSFQIQIREMTPEDYRRRDEAKAARAFGPGGSGLPSGPGSGARPGMGMFDHNGPPLGPPLPNNDHVPF